MRKEEREELLLELYKWQVEQGHSKGGQINRDPSNPDDYRNKREIVKYWEEKGIIEVVAEATGFISIKLTSYGIDYVEENLL